MQRQNSDVSSKKGKDSVSNNSNLKKQQSADDSLFSKPLLTESKDEEDVILISGSFQTMKSFGRELQPVLHSLKEEMGAYENNNYPNDIRKSLSSKIEEVENKIMEEKELRLDAQKYLVRFTSSADCLNKTLLKKLEASIKDIDKDISFLRNALQQLKDMSAERWGLSPKYVQSLINPHECCTYLSLSENVVNSLDLTLGGGTNKNEIITATPLGLCAYLYSREAFSQSYVKDFFVMFRRFMKVTDLADFLMKRHTLASNKVMVDGAQSSDAQSQILFRTIDLLHYWTTKYYVPDFKLNEPLKRKIKLFIKRYVQQWDSSENVQRILHMLVTGRSLSQESFSSAHEDEPEQLRSSPVQKHVYRVIDEINSERFKESKGKSSSLSNLGLMFKKSSPITQVKTKKVIGNNDLFGVDIKLLVQQFCLIEQKVYQSMDILVLLETRANCVSNHKQECSVEAEAPICQYLKWHDRVTRWAVLVILSALNPKIQIGMIQKFASLARACAEERNFSTAMQIFSALCDQQIIQLEAILQISLKTTSILEDLHLIRESLVSDTSWLSSGKSIPLLPPLKIYLCHIQQIELGSPMGNNGLIKWTKCREIAEKVDCMRDFQSNAYPFEPNEVLEHKVVNEIRAISTSDEISFQPNYSYFASCPGSKRAKINSTHIKALLS